MTIKCTIMPKPLTERRIAMLCTPDSQRGAFAPFVDLEGLVLHGRDVDGESAMAPALRFVTLYDATDAAPPFEAARPTRFSETEPLYDAIVLPAGYDLAAPAPPSAAMIEWLRRHHARGAWLCGLGSGVLALAAAGLLDHRRASIPPRHEGMVRSRHPNIFSSQASSINEQDGILTASEASSVFIMVTMLAARIHSQGLAERYRRVCGLRETWIPGDTPFPKRRNQDMLVAEARAWIVAHLQEDIDTSTIAAQFHVSGRTLIRRFERAMDISPAGFLRLARMDAAISMLQRTRFSVEQIAHLAGYGDVSAFRDAFRSHTGLSPRQFRMASGADVVTGEAPL